MKKIIDHLKNNWVRHGFETVVVMVGILSAYALNNWNEERKARVLEKEMLMEIEAGLEGDLADIQANLNVQQSALNSQEIIINWLENDLDYHDSLCYHFANSFSFTMLIANEGPYETLKGIGLKLISNGVIRDRISSLYDQKYENYHATFEHYNNFIVEMLADENQKYFGSSFPFDLNSHDYIGCIVPRQGKRIKETDFSYIVKTLHSWNALLIEVSIVRTRDEVADLIEKIQDEVSR